MGDEGESNLEMRCSADEAWYDGTLRVSPDSKDLIVVHFNDFDDDEDETFHKDDLREPAKLKSRVRVRSLQLQDTQCRRVYEDQRICGCLDDGEDRKYYDAEVTSIIRKKHAFKDGGEECLCKFTVLWLDGPKKGGKTVIGCAEVCFLSMDEPQDDPMMKNLLNTLAANGNQPRRRLLKSAPPAKNVPKSVPSPRPRTPSPSLELAPSKKQPSREPSPATAPPNPKIPELARTRALAVGSKKKRIMQAEENQNEIVASENGNLDHGVSDAIENSNTVRPRSEEAAGRDGSENNREDAEQQRAMSEHTKKGSVEKSRLGVRDGSENNTEGAEQQKETSEHTKKGSVEKSRLGVKGKAKVGTIPSEGGEEDGMQDSLRSRSGPLKERLKLNTRRMAAADKAEKKDVVIESLAERVKLKKTAKTGPSSDAAPAPAPVRDEPAVAKPDNMPPVVQSLGERVKLKTAQKSPASSPLESHKESLEKIGKMVVKEKITKRKLIQLEEPSPDPMKAKFDKVVKPRVMSKPIMEVMARPHNVVVEQPPKVQPSVHKRKAGRPRKHPPRESAATPETESARAKKHHQNVETLTVQKQTPREEGDEAHQIVIDAIDVENSLPGPATRTMTRKRPRQEEEEKEETPQLNSNDIVSNKSLQEEEVHTQINSHQPNEEVQQNKKLAIRDDDDDRDSTIVNTTIIAEEHEPPRILDDATEMSCHMEYISIPDKLRNIENKYNSCFSAPQAALQLITIATGSDHYHPAASTPHDPFFRVSPPPEDHIISSPNPSSGDFTKSRELQLVSADVMAVLSRPQQHGFRDDAAVESARGGIELNGCAPPVVAKQVDDGRVEMETEMTGSRLLMVENMEMDASALDAMQLLLRRTDGVCAVHVLPVLQFHTSATGYALYRDCASAAKALRWLTSPQRFVVSPRGRPWIVSQAREAYGPRIYGIATYTAYKSDDPNMCGIISDQPHVHNLVVVTTDDMSSYFRAQQMSKLYEEHKKWQKELYERIMQHEKKTRELDLC